MRRGIARCTWTRQANSGRFWGQLTRLTGGLMFFLIFLVLLESPPTALPGAQGSASETLNAYADLNHCLASGEIRSDEDNPISCLCEQAIANARYIYFNYYSLPHPDPDMKAIFTVFEFHAQEICSRDSAERISKDSIGEFVTATTSEDWKWSGPEVVRTYPPYDVIRQIKPDSRGYVSVPYTALLLWRDSQGQVTRTESLSAHQVGPPEYFVRPPPPPERPARNARPKP